MSMIKAAAEGLAWRSAAAATAAACRSSAHDWSARPACNLHQGTLLHACAAQTKFELVRTAAAPCGSGFASLSSSLLRQQDTAAQRQAGRSLFSQVGVGSRSLPSALLEQEILELLFA